MGPFAPRIPLLNKTFLEFKANIVPIDVPFLLELEVFMECFLAPDNGKQNLYRKEKNGK